jgi:hypothetical protein
MLAEGSKTASIMAVRGMTRDSAICKGREGERLSLKCRVVPLKRAAVIIMADITIIIGAGSSSWQTSLSSLAPGRHHGRHHYHHRCQVIIMKNIIIIIGAKSSSWQTSLSSPVPGHHHGRHHYHPRCQVIIMADIIIIIGARSASWQTSF